MGVCFIEYFCRYIQKQIIRSDLSRNTSIVEETKELIDSASHGGEQSADSLRLRRNRVTQSESKQLVDVLT